MPNTNLPQIIFVSTTQYTFLITDIYARYIYNNYGIVPIVFYRTVRNFDVSKFDTEGKYIIYPYSVKNRTAIGQCAFALQCGYLFHSTKLYKAISPNKETIIFAFNDKNKLVSRLFREIKSANKNNKIVLIEEGTDTYTDYLELKHPGLYRLKHKFSRFLFGIGRTSDVIGANPLIEYAIVKKPDKYKTLSKSHNQKVLQQDPDILQSSGDFTKHYSGASSNDLRCDVMYIGQPYYKNGQYFEYENLCIEQIIDALPDDTEIFIKPHPRESSKKYRKLVSRYDNVSIMSEELAPLPIEALLNILNPRTVVSVNSSASVTVANLFPSITSFVLKNTPEAIKLDEKLREAGQELPQIEDDYFQSRNMNILLPESLTEYSKLTLNALKTRRVIKQFTETPNGYFKEIDYFLSENPVDNYVQTTD